MLIKGITDEDFVNYKKPSMFIAFPNCTFKCEKESGVRCCQNSDLATSPNIDISYDRIVERYVKNNISKAIVCGGLEPLDSFNDLCALIWTFRRVTPDDIVIYTGYNKTEILSQLETIKSYSNIIVKFGRFIPNQSKHYDEILGVYLMSDNQYAEQIS